MRHVLWVVVWLGITLAVSGTAVAQGVVVAASAPTFDEVAAAAPRDTRHGVLRPKVMQLLLTELANVERLYKATPAKDADRPRLQRRLAEGYVELAACAQRDAVAADQKAASAALADRGRADKYRRRASKARRVVKAARKQAIKYYSNLRKQYPSFCQYRKNKPGARGCGDEVLYYLALAHERAGNLEQARRAYLELVQNWPKSRFMPHAYYAFGDMFVREAAGDPSKWPIAQNFFVEVLKYPPPDNRLFGFATYMLARAHAGQRQDLRALNELQKLETFAHSFPTLTYSRELGEAAAAEASALRVGTLATP